MQMLNCRGSALSPTSDFCQHRVEPRRNYRAITYCKIRHGVERFSLREFRNHATCWQVSVKSVLRIDASFNGVALEFTIWNYFGQSFA